MVSEIEPFHYESVGSDKPKAVVTLCRSDIVKASVQYVRQGGRNNLHSHSGNDGVWLVMKGRARFFGENGSAVAELGVNDGVLVPRGTPYWFESTGNEPLEILHIAAFEKNIEDRRTDYEPRGRAGG